MLIPGALRPRTNAEILDAAFAVVRRFAGQLFPLSLLIGLPQSILTLPFLKQSEGSPHLSGRVLIGFMLSTVIERVRLWLLEAAVVEAMVNGRVDWAGAGRRVGTSLWPLAWSSIRLALWSGIAMIPFVVPGVIVFLHRMFYAEALLAEGRIPTSAMARSRALTEGSVGRLGWLMLGFSLLFGALSLGSSAWASGSVLKAGISWVSTGVFVPVMAAFYVVAYYDLRARHEGLDLVVRDAELERLRQRVPGAA